MKITDLHKHLDTVLRTEGNHWHRFLGIEIYVRNLGYHSVDGELIGFLDIANITIKKKGKGTFTHILDYLEPKTNIFIENVLNERLASWLAKNHKGYMRVNGSSLPCFYRLITTDEKVIEIMRNELCVK